MKKIACIGSATMDVMVSPVDAMPPAGTLYAVENTSLHPGGCAVNVAMDLGKLGFSAGAFCMFGKDSFGDILTQKLSDEGVDVNGIVYTEKAPTTVSVVLVGSSGERTFLYNPGSTALMDENTLEREKLANYDIIFVAGAMLLPSFDGAPCAKFMADMRKIGKFTAMDTAWDPDGIWLAKIKEVLPHLDLFMPSQAEAEKLTEESDPHKMADKLFSYGCGSVVIKLGKRGALVCPKKDKRYLIPAIAGVKPVDTTGAGDAFCSGFLAGLSLGWDYEKSATFAHGVSGCCILKRGASTGILPMEQTLAFMKEHGVTL